jgi:hypothetical protein
VGFAAIVRIAGEINAAGRCIGGAGGCVGTIGGGAGTTGGSEGATGVMTRVGKADAVEERGRV